MLTQRREPCLVDVWHIKVVQNSSRFQIEANKPHVFRVLITTHIKSIKTDAQRDINEQLIK